MIVDNMITRIDYIDGQRVLTRKTAKLDKEQGGAFCGLLHLQIREWRKKGNQFRQKGVDA